MKSDQHKPSIVFAHGLWADGSCFGKLIPTLQAEGHEVIAAQNSLDTLKGDVATVMRALGRNPSTGKVDPDQKALDGHDDRS